MSKNIELTRRKVLGSAAVVGAASAGAGAGTFAYFSDDESVNDNTIGAGTLELDVGDGSGGSFSYGFSEIAPGQSATVSATIENTGTIDAGEVIVSTTTDIGSDSENLATQLNITEIRWNGSAISSPPATVEALTSNNLELTPAPTSGSSIDLEVDVTFDSGAGNDYQDVSVDVDHTFTLNQVEDQ